MSGGYGYTRREEMALPLVPGADHSRIGAPTSSDSLGGQRLPGSGHIVDASAGIIRSELSDFLVGLDDALLTVTDRQATPETRVRLGRLGTGLDEYGLEIYNAAGSLLFGAIGALVSAANISVNQLSELTDDAGILVSGVLQGSSVTLDLDATGTDPILSATNLTINADGSMALGSHFSVDAAGNVTFSGDLDGAGGTVAAEVFTGTDATFYGSLAIGSAYLLGTGPYVRVNGYGIVGSQVSLGSSLRSWGLTLDGSDWLELTAADGGPSTTGVSVVGGFKVSGTPMLGTRAAASVPGNFSADYFISIEDKAGNTFVVPGMTVSW